MTTTQDRQDQTANGTTKRKGRSPAYPAIDLPEALQKAEVIRKAEGKNATHVDTALQHWGYKAKSGGGMAALSALIKFGLLEDEGKGDERRVRLTQLALRILLDDLAESPERLKAVREAALLPAIHKELWEKYQGALPSDQTIRFYLRHDRVFQDDAADSCIQEFRSSLAYARLPESGTISPEASDTETFEGEQTMSQQQTPVATATPAAQPRTDVQPENKQESSGGALRPLQLPLSADTWATLTAPFPLTKQAWEQMLAVLNAMKPALVKNEGPPG